MATLSTRTLLRISFHCCMSVCTFLPSLRSTPQAASLPVGRQRHGDVQMLQFSISVYNPFPSQPPHGAGAAIPNAPPCSAVHCWRPRAPASVDADLSLACSARTPAPTPHVDMWRSPPRPEEAVPMAERSMESSTSSECGPARSGSHDDATVRARLTGARGPHRRRQWHGDERAVG